MKNQTIPSKHILCTFILNRRTLYYIGHFRV